MAAPLYGGTDSGRLAISDAPCLPLEALARVHQGKTQPGFQLLDPGDAVLELRTAGFGPRYPHFPEHHPSRSPSVRESEALQRCLRLALDAPVLRLWTVLGRDLRGLFEAQGFFEGGASEPPGLEGVAGVPGRVPPTSDSSRM